MRLASPWRRIKIYGGSASRFLRGQRRKGTAFPHTGRQAAFSGRQAALSGHLSLVRECCGLCECWYGQQCELQDREHRLRQNRTVFHLRIALRFPNCGVVVVGQQTAVRCPLVFLVKAYGGGTGTAGCDHGAVETRQYKRTARGLLVRESRQFTNLSNAKPADRHSSGS